MMTNLQYLNIYEYAIDVNIEKCERLLKSQGFSDDSVAEMNGNAFRFLRKVGSWGNITNSIIYAYYLATSEKMQEIDIDCTWFINCGDSHFYIGKNGVFEEV